MIHRPLEGELGPKFIGLVLVVLPTVYCEADLALPVRKVGIRNVLNRFSGEFDDRLGEDLRVRRHPMQLLLIHRIHRDQIRSHHGPGMRMGACQDDPIDWDLVPMGDLFPDAERELPINPTKIQRNQEPSGPLGIFEDDRLRPEVVQGPFRGRRPRPIAGHPHRPLGGDRHLRQPDLPAPVFAGGRGRTQCRDREDRQRKESSQSEGVADDAHCDAPSQDQARTRKENRHKSVERPFPEKSIIGRRCRAVNENSGGSWKSSAQQSPRILARSAKWWTIAATTRLQVRRTSSGVLRCGCG